MRTNLAKELYGFVEDKLRAANRTRMAEEFHELAQGGPKGRARYSTILLHESAGCLASLMAALIAIDAKMDVSEDTIRRDNDA